MSNMAEQIKQLEAELDEMTVALAHAWDQLIPLLQSESTSDANPEWEIVPLLESILAALDAEIVLVYLYDDREWLLVPAQYSLTPDIKKKVEQVDKQAVYYHDKSTDWAFIPIITENTTAGVVGVATDGKRELTSVEVRIVERMAERFANRIVATQLAISREKEAALRRELEIAHSIQRTIQPTNMPGIHGIEVATFWLPAQQVGGDAWGWVQQPSGNLCCFLLDVAGKGLPAALAAVSLQSAIRVSLRTGMSPVDAIINLNAEFYHPYTLNDLMATVTILSLDLETRTIEQANAGHPPTLIYTHQQWQQFEATVPPIGVLEEIYPESQTASLTSDSIIVCYSDGFSELPTDDGLWGEQGIINAIDPESSSAATMVDQIIESAHRVASTTHDDQTLLIIKFS